MTQTPVGTRCHSRHWRARVLLILTLATSALTGACAPVLSNTHIDGDRASVTQLVGKWEGTYSSTETGRSGFITFSLRAGTDTAQGDVIMTARTNESSGMDNGREGVRPPQHTSQVITIRFVVASGDEVVGMLDPYNDPVCGCSLVTRFRGRLRGDAISGTFESNSAEIFHRPTSGEWSVARVVASTAIPPSP